MYVVDKIIRHAGFSPRLKYLERGYDDRKAEDTVELPIPILLPFINAYARRFYIHRKQDARSAAS